MKLIILITAKIENGLDVALGWKEVGAPGVTIIPAHGLHTLQQQLESGEVELPRMVVSMAAAMAHLMGNAEQQSQVFLSVVEDELVDPLIAEANKQLGDLTEPHNGVLFVLNIERAIGVRRHG